MKLNSNRPHLLLLGACLLAVSGNSPAAAQDARAVREKLLPSVVLVESRGAGGGVTDLGLYVRPDVFAVNYASVRGVGGIRARSHGRRETLEVRGAVCRDNVADFVLLRVGGARGRPPEFADPRAARAGDPVYVLVSDDEGNLTVVAGRLAAAGSPEPDAPGGLLNVEASLPDGSAGALVADARGRVLGLITDGQHPFAETLTATPLTHLLSGRGARAAQPEPDAGGCATWLADERGFERDKRVREEEALRLQSVLRRVVRRGSRRRGPATETGGLQRQPLPPPPPPLPTPAPRPSMPAPAPSPLIIERAGPGPQPYPAPYPTPEPMPHPAASPTQVDPDEAARLEADVARARERVFRESTREAEAEARTGATRNGHEARPAPTPFAAEPPAQTVGASAPADGDAVGGVVERNENYVVVRVFYGTDRKPTGSRLAEDFYGGERGARDGYAAGFCDVSIPKTHRPGRLEEPSIWRLEFRRNPARHFVLKSVNPLGREDFFSRLRDAFARTGGADALVFVHGFNVPFADAARRTAQLSYDLKFNGVPLMYSWPSQGSPTLLGYTTDEGNVEWTVPHLKQFLEDLSGSTGGPVRIHLIAHSMGNRALANALRAIAHEQRPAPLFNQVILTAPDIDAAVFERDIAPAIQKTAAQVTLYASSDDKTMILSKSLRGGYQRAGESGNLILAIPGVVTIDASGIDTSLLGHSYYAEVEAIINDMNDILRHGYGPAQRKLQALTKGAVTYWGLVAAAAATGTSNPTAAPPGGPPQVPGGGGGAPGMPLPALALLAALALAAVVLLLYRLARRRRGAS